MFLDTDPLRAPTFVPMRGPRRKVKPGDVFVPRKKGQDFGRKLRVPGIRKLPRLPGPLGLGLGLIDVVDGMLSHRNPKGYAPAPGAGWYLRSDCGRSPGKPMYIGPALSGWRNVGAYFESFGSQLTNCLTDQAPSTVSHGPWSTLATIPAAHNTLMLSDVARSDAGILRARHDRVWWRDATTSPATKLIPGWTLTPQRDLKFPTANPNRLRHAPAEAPAPPAPAAAPSLPAPWRWTNGDGPVAPAGRAPPKPGRKEKKLISNTARIGIYLYKVLDELSENAEIVDALFEALPKDVQTRWKKDRKRDGRFADQAGQYGIDGADWKLQALYHNWHKVDALQGVKNIIRNNLEDGVIGAYQKLLPRNTVNGLGEHEAIISKQLSDIFDHLGL